MHQANIQWVSGGAGGKQWVSGDAGGKQRVSGDAGSKQLVSGGADSLACAIGPGGVGSKDDPFQSIPG